jgi:predicted tellurium resistance membrane protein TerC
MDPEPEEKETSAGNVVAIGFAAAIGQILLLDLVFSIDSIITAGCVTGAGLVRLNPMH